MILFLAVIFLHLTAKLDETRRHSVRGVYSGKSYCLVSLVVLQKTRKNRDVFGLKVNKNICRSTGCIKWGPDSDSACLKTPITTFCLNILMDLNFSQIFVIKFWIIFPYFKRGQLSCSRHSAVVIITPALACFPLVFTCNSCKRFQWWYQSYPLNFTENKTTFRLYFYLTDYPHTHS